MAPRAAALTSVRTNVGAMDCTRWRSRATACLSPPRSSSPWRRAALARACLPGCAPSRAGSSAPTGRPGCASVPARLRLPAHTPDGPTSTRSCCPLIVSDTTALWPRVQRLSGCERTVPIDSCTVCIAVELPASTAISPAALSGRRVVSITLLVPAKRWASTCQLCPPSAL